MIAQVQSGRSPFERYTATNRSERAAEYQRQFEAFNTDSGN